MKKLIALSFILALSMQGCSFVAVQIDEEVKDIKEELQEFEKEAREELGELQNGLDVKQPAQNVLTEEQVLSAITPHLKAFNGVLSENFGAVTDNSEVYYAAYPKIGRGLVESGDLDGDEGVILIKDPQILPDGYEMDGTYTNYIAVTNYADEDEIEEKYSAFMDDDIFEGALEGNFEEYMGKLFLVRGGRGYGAISIDVSSAEVVGVTGNTYAVKVKRMLFDEFDGEYVLNFARTGDDFLITGVNESWVGDNK